MKKVLLLLFVSAFSNAKEFPDIKLSQLLTPLEQKSIGVNKLSDNEKEALRLTLINKYLEGYKKGKETTPVKNQESSYIESQIDGDFEGFEGETVIKLMNGQIWQQTDFFFHYHYSFMPKVLIFKSNGIYKMKVDGIDKAVSVRLLN